MTDNSVHYVRISEHEPLPPLDSLAPYRAVIVLSGNYSDEWQDDVSRWLVNSGCRYMMAWGPNCSSWDDSVDYAVIQKFLPSEAPDAHHVMTTWHEDETLESVFWYCQFCAQFSSNDVELHQAVIVDVSEHERKDWILALYQRAATLADREEEAD